ncbi:hypothetical protein ACIA5H_35330 [Nocardia sp. NPDC051900]|uniref:hypothetical protein n=1 Tax=Nocardia sp. NPDC051900 TaxID=3364326 RepID=UPI0037AF8255
MTSPVDNRQSLLEKVEFLRKKKDEIGDLPEKVNTYAGHLVEIVRSQAYGGALTGNLGPALTVEDTVDQIWSERDKANKAIGETWDKLDVLDPDLEVPIKFIDVANEWRTLRGNLLAAGNDFGDTVLSTAEWQGDAAVRYGEMRTRQQVPLDSLPLEFDKIAGSLERIASSELALYGELATKTQDLIAKVEDAALSSVKDLLDVVKISVGGAVSLIKNLVAVVEAANTFIIGVVKSMADAAKTDMIEGNNIMQIVANQKGLPDGKWPSGVKASYGAGIGGIREAIGDASAKDGDKSDWTVGQ